MWGDDLQGQRQVLCLGSPPHPAGQQRARAEKMVAVVMFDKSR